MSFPANLRSPNRIRDLSHPTTTHESYNVTSETPALYHLTVAYIRYSSLSSEISLQWLFFFLFSKLIPLLIGWSARIFLLLSYHKIPFTASFVNLYHTIPPTPSNTVPSLRINSIQNPSADIASESQPLEITDSLAISLYLHRTHPDLHLLPSDPGLYALALTACAEMHSGFSQLREWANSNFWSLYPSAWDFWPEEAQKGVERDIRRIVGIWEGARAATERVLEKGIEGVNKGECDYGYLFGTYGVADAMFAPVLWRIRSYELGEKVEGLWDGRSRAKEWAERMWEKGIGGGRMEVERRIDESFWGPFEDLYGGREEVTEGWRFHG